MENDMTKDELKKALEKAESLRDRIADEAVRELVLDMAGDPDTRDAAALIKAVDKAAKMHGENPVMLAGRPREVTLGVLARIRETALERQVNRWTVRNPVIMRLMRGRPEWPAPDALVEKAIEIERERSEAEELARVAAGKAE